MNFSPVSHNPTLPICFFLYSVGKRFQHRSCACRNSAGLPMISIDARGTMILDKRCITALNTIKNSTATPEFDPKKKTFKLTFGKKGLLNIRTIESHASLSMMGTFHSFGVKLPESHVRYCVQISGNVMTFKL